MKMNTAYLRFSAPVNYLLVASSLLLFFCALPLRTEAQESFNLHFSPRTLSVTALAKQVPLSLLIQKLNEEGVHIRLFAEQNMKKTFSLNLHNAPVDVVLKHLFGENNYLSAYSPDKVEVFVLRTGDRQAPPPLTYTAGTTSAEKTLQQSQTEALNLLSKQNPKVAKALYERIKVSTIPPSLKKERISQERKAHLAKAEAIRSINKEKIFTQAQQHSLDSLLTLTTLSEVKKDASPFASATQAAPAGSIITAYQPPTVKQAGNNSSAQTQQKRQTNIQKNTQPATTQETTPQKATASKRETPQLSYYAKLASYYNAQRRNSSPGIAAPSQNTQRSSLRTLNAINQEKMKGTRKVQTLQTQMGILIH